MVVDHALDELKRAVEVRFGCTAELRDVVPVSESLPNDVLWMGEVHVFALEDHRNRSVAYAWAWPVAPLGSSRIFVMAQSTFIGSPAHAVRAALAGDPPTPAPVKDHD